MKYFITGGCGFLGSNLASEVLKRGEELIVFDNLFREGGVANLEWLKSQGEFKHYRSDIRNAGDVETAIKEVQPDIIFHLAGQVAMTTSIQNPRLDFEINNLGSFNLLDSVRKYAPEAMVLYSSTNKVYGDLEQYNYDEAELRYNCREFPRGFPENIPLEFHSPYGCSKGAADQYMSDFHRIFGIKTVVFRHSSMYGGRQFATYDQGWIGWFCQKAIEVSRGQGEEFTISGNGKQVRDVLYASDMNDLYFKTVQNIDKAQGQSFNIGGGIENSLSLLELFAMLEKELNIKLNYKQLPVRESDQRLFVADITKAGDLIGWAPKVDKTTGIRSMLEWTTTI